MATGLENLRMYTLASELEVEVYKLTNSFPTEEKYRSVDQLRRSSSAVSNNIAESYHRRSIKEKLRLVGDIAKAEAEETCKNLEITNRKGFHEDSDIISRYLDLIKMISGYVRFLNKRANLPTSQRTN